MRGGILILLLFLLVAFTLGVVVASRGPSLQYRAALEAQRLETQAKMNVLKVIFWRGLAAVVLLFLAGLSMAFLHLLWQRSQLIRHDAHGLFPIVRGRAGWPILRPSSRCTYFHDPNRQLAGTTAYRAGPDGLEVQQPLPAGMEAEQLQIATQAQAVQLVTAASQGATPASTRRLVQDLANRSSRRTPRMPEIRLLSPEIPEERLLLAAIRRDWQGEDDDGHPADHPRHCETLFRGLRHTLLNRGLYRPLKDGRLQEVAWKRAILLPDLGVVAFEVDTLRLPVRIEQLLDPDVAHQIQATLNGRQVRVTNSRGLVFGVKLEPEEPRPQVRLPRRVALDVDTRPAGRYLFPIGVGAAGAIWRSLLDTGHILVGGETGSGKSTFLNAMLTALLQAHTPDELQVAVVDPKEVEFQAYGGLPHLFAPIAAEVTEAAALTARLLAEMDRRRVLFARAAAKSLAAYNRRANEPLPLLLLIVDEVTDIALQAGLKSAFYKDLIRLTSKGRAFGLVVVLATQNPKAEVLNTLIRGNMSTRVAFRVATAEHSKTILGVGGAQELPRTVRGRMLARLDGQPVTLQGFYVSDEAIAALAARLREEKPQALSDLHRRLVQHAQQHLDGRFVIDKLWKAFGGEVGRDALMALARRWERVGWLAPQSNPAEARRVTDELLRLASVSDK